MNNKLTLSWLSITPFGLPVVPDLKEREGGEREGDGIEKRERRNTIGRRARREEREVEGYGKERREEREEME